MDELDIYKLRSEALDIQIPDFDWHIGDLDASNYDDLKLEEESYLKALENPYYEDGFYVEY